MTPTNRVNKSVVHRISQLYIEYVSYIMLYIYMYIFVLLGAQLVTWLWNMLTDL